MKSLEEFIEQKEAADTLHCSPKQAGNWARSRIIPSYKVGKKRLYRKSELITWMEAQASKSEFEMDRFAQKYKREMNEKKASAITN